MVTCAECDSDDIFPHTCSLCNSKFCPQHRLPESHDCPGLIFEEASQRWFTDKDKAPVGRQTPPATESPTRVWECVECERQHPYNPTKCVKCGHKVLKPIHIAEEDREELFIDRARRRREKQRRQQSTESNADTTDVDKSNPPLQTSLWRFQSGILTRLQSALGNATNKLLIDIDSDVFIRDPEAPETRLYHVQPTNLEGDETRYMVTTYTYTEDNDSIVSLEKTGTRVYNETQLGTRLPRRITHDTDCEWNQNDQILEFTE